MELVTIAVVALGLAMDAFAVSITSGAAYRQLHVKQAFLIAAFFGGFQAFMPLIGSLAGLGMKGYIADYVHWLAFGLLGAVGGKMIYESFKIKKAEDVSDPTNLLVLLVLAIATSIDALAVGVTLSLITNRVVAAALIIGLITFILSYIGVLVGKRFGHFFENRIEAFGGIILIGLGVKIVIQHLFF